MKRELKDTVTMELAQILPVVDLRVPLTVLASIYKGSLPPNGPCVETRNSKRVKLQGKGGEAVVVYTKLITSFTPGVFNLALSSPTVLF
jgi:hypothetical protein